MKASDLVFDWNTADGPDRPARERVEVADLTLRDGLQSPSVVAPDPGAQAELLHLMVALGVEGVEIGLPGAGPRFLDQSERLAKEAASNKLPLDIFCAARTVRADLTAVVEVSQRSGVPVGVSTFLGASPIRQAAEAWTLDGMLRRTEDAVTFGVSHGLPVTFVTEDTSRSRPEDLRALYTTALRAGAKRLCVCDTTGHATPAGVRAVVRFVRAVADEVSPGTAIDWHGHQDRGLALANALEAYRAGADRAHGCGLGTGERVGNTAMDQLLVNLVLLGWRTSDLSRLPEYGRRVAQLTGAPIPPNYPVLGHDAFRTMTGVHAAAIRKARALGPDAEDVIYSGVPAALVGRAQQVELGPMSGESNAVWWLETHGVEASAENVRLLLGAAKDSDRILTEAEIEALLLSSGVARAAALRG